MKWGGLTERVQQLSMGNVKCFFGGYLLACILLLLTVWVFSLETKVPLVELLASVLPVCLALGVPLLLKRLTSDADARRSLFLEDVSTLFALYESSSIAMREYREKGADVECIKADIRRFISLSERSLDLIQSEITHLGRFALPSALQEAVQAYDQLMGDAPFTEGFKITDDFLKRQDELLHAIKLEVRKYQYGVFFQ